MKVLIVSNGFPPSGQWGTEYYTHQLATGLQARGQTVRVLCPIRDGSRPRYTVERSRRYGIELVEVHNAGDPRKSFVDSYANERIEALFAELLEAERPDVVHYLHLLWGLSVRLPLLTRARSIPSVVSLTDFGLLCHRGQLFDHRSQACGGPHAPEVCARCIREPGAYDSRGVVRQVKRGVVHAIASLGGLGRVVTPWEIEERQTAIAEVLGAVDHFVAPTRGMAYAFQCAGVARDRLTQLYYGIDERPYIEALERARGRPAPAAGAKTEYRFGFLGQFEPHKGLHRLFQAVGILARRLPESLDAWSVHLYGNPVGGRNRHYVDWSWRRELSDRIRFRGPFAPLDAPRIMADLDAVVVPSQWAENAPLTVLQARILGLPVIATDVAGIREVVQDGGRALLVDPKSPVALAEAMARVLRERRGRDPEPHPPVSYAEHIERITRIYEELRAATEPRVPAPESANAVLAGR